MKKKISDALVLESFDLPSCGQQAGNSQGEKRGNAGVVKAFYESLVLTIFARSHFPFSELSELSFVATKLHYVLFVISLLLITSCYEPKEGCLDVDATNFDVAADIACPDNCCVYPLLKLSIAHKAGDAFLSFDSIYTTNKTNRIRIKDVRFYMTQVHLISSSGASIGLRDSIELSVRNAGVDELITVEDNFKIISRESSSYTFGEIRASGELKEIQFLVGVPIEVNSANPLSVAEGHPLAIQTDTMHWDQNAGYIFNKISFQPDTSSSELKKIEIGSIANLVAVKLPITKTIRKGFDIKIAIEIDYLEWFKGIDFAASDLEIRRIIIQNTPNAFTIVK